MAKKVIYLVILSIIVGVLSNVIVNQLYGAAKLLGE